MTKKTKFQVRKLMSKTGYERVIGYDVVDQDAQVVACARSSDVAYVLAAAPEAVDLLREAVDRGFLNRDLTTRANELLLRARPPVVISQQ